MGNRFSFWRLQEKGDGRKGGGVRKGIAGEGG